RFQQQLERKDRIIVGVNDFVAEEEPAIPTLKIDPEVERRQIERTRRVRAERDGSVVERRLAGLRRAAEGSENTMDHILECVRAYATLGEICGMLKKVYGEYREPAII
ncbi:MAG: methylmalonyl-CoA mutase family protein, partial [Armatimonadota bacterium]